VGLAELLAGDRVLVTGGGGFVGSHLVERLAGVADVCVLDDFSGGSPEVLSDTVEVHRADVRDEAAVARAIEGAEVAFHQAGAVSVAESVREPERTHAVNVGGTLNVLERAREADCRVVFASSAAVYGEPTATPISETEPLAPESPYGIQKLAADHYVRRYHDLYGLETVALRYFNVYGPRRGTSGGVVDAFLERARSGEPLRVHGDGSQERDFVHVEDVVDANLRAATTDAVGAAYNVGTGTATSVADLAALVADLAGSESDVEHADAREGDIAVSVADVGRAESALGYRPRVSLETGLAELCGVEQPAGT
jgi:UDP-glucose 4-epimerase